MTDFGVRFSENINFNEFLYLMKSKSRLLDKSNIYIYFRYPEIQYFKDIIDDGDVSELIGVSKEVERKLANVNVYVVFDDSDDANEDDDDRGKAYGANISNEKGSNNLICTFITPGMPQFRSVAKNVNVVISVSQCC